MYDKAAAINHKMYGANYNLGLIAFIQRDYETAERYFENSLYDDFEAMSYYQLAKICVLKGEKDKAIAFVNKAIELDSTILKIVEKESCFRPIREHITVSVKLDGKTDYEEEQVVDEDDKPFEYEDYSNGYKRNSIILEQEKKAREYLEASVRLIEEMSENSSRQKIDERLDYLFKKDNIQKEAEEEKEKEEAIKNFLGKTESKDIINKNFEKQKYMDNN